MTEAPRILVVASEDTAQAWARRLVDDGFPALPVAFSTVAPGPDVGRAAEALRDASHAPADARPLVIVTSRNAVRFLPVGAAAGLSALVVGAATASAARDAGFVADAGPASESASGFASVARRVLAACRAPRAALWLRGDVATREGVDLLGGAGWRIEEFVTYRAVPRASFDSELRRALPARAWVVGSPAAARALVAALGVAAFPPESGGARVFVPGETTAASLDVPRRVAAEIVPGLPEGLAERLRRAGPTSPSRP